ncbi:hypothetical protein IWQ62_006337 [Dispira parvispora]|uniref:DUF7719 domain-containing protein n=1 Tax=Dispira parvispora TaxID=1520584 RepID=A0A9W8AN78_9FUNG|nr:hypothetical protein IWQ62_006337 [Dispira parvispora]
MSAPRQRHSKSPQVQLAPESKFEELENDDIPHVEKLRIIEQSGLLKAIPKPDTKPAKPTHLKKDDGDAEEEEDEEEDEIPVWVIALFQSILLGFVYATFEILVQQQYGADWEALEVALKVAKGYPLLMGYSYLTYRFQAHPAMKVFQWLIATLSGCYFLYLNNHSPAIGIMQRCPGLITIWLHGIFMADNIPTAVMLGFIGGFWYYDTRLGW